jgi:hypothetical protein
MRRSAITASLTALAAMLALAPAAGAARLQVTPQWVLIDPWGGGYYENFVTYAAASGEANRLVVGGQGGHVITLYDPGTPMSPQMSGALPKVDPDVLVDNTNVPVSEAYSCSAPTSKSYGACTATPGYRCYFDEMFRDCGRFNRGTHFLRIEIALGDLRDTVRLLPGSALAVVSTGSGNDSVDSRNRVADRVDCGAGADTVVADAKDVVYSTCETVTRG